jgi:predicted Zn-dependent protease
VGEIRATIEELKAKASGSLVVDRDQYLRRIDGLVYGDNPEDGVVRGDLFLHPALRFALSFPPGWEVNNTETQVTARQPGTDVYMLLQMVEQPQGRTLEEIATQAMRRSGFTRLSGQPTTINGLPAYVGVYEGSAERLGKVGVRAAHIEHNRQIFMLAGIARRDEFAREDRFFDEALKSFRALTRQEADEIRPNLIDLYVVRSGDTWQSIAQRTGGIIKATTLAIMNASPVNSVPEPGRLIKVVVAG